MSSWSKLKKERLSEAAASVQVELELEPRSPQSHNPIILQSGFWGFPEETFPSGTDFIWKILSLLATWLISLARRQTPSCLES